MQFNSYGFVLAFMPISLILYYALVNKKKYKESNIILLVESIIFYCVYNWKNFLVLLVIAMFNYYVSRKLLVCSNSTMFIDKSGDESDVKLDNNKFKDDRLLLGIAIVANVLVLCFFKYNGFFVDSLNSILKNDSVFSTVIMPLGISFFIFQQIAYLVDSYRLDGVTPHTLQQHLLFSFFFPTITSGPITYHSEMMPQFMDYKAKELNYENILKGLYLFSLGLAKKVLIAQVLSSAFVTCGECLFELKFTNAFLTMICYTLEIYFDFSGYSDMALGVAKMFGIDLPINFDSPYKAYNITDFWNRWHITLTRFLTKYIYIPLGGNRKGKFRTYINIMIVFVVSGLWHGAALTFFIWGILHGIYSVIYRLCKKIYDMWHPAFQWIVTFLSVSFAWIYFGFATKEEANILVSKLLTPEFDDINVFIADCFNTTGVDIICENLLGRSAADTIPTMMIVFLVVAFYIVMCTENNMRIIKEGFVYKKRHAVATVLLLVVSMYSFAGVSTFIYSTF